MLTSLDTFVATWAGYDDLVIRPVGDMEEEQANARYMLNVCVPSTR